MDFIASALSHLTCSRCDTRHEPDEIHRFCACGGPLYPRYDLDSVSWTPESLANRPGGLWRYADLLPVRAPEHRICLGEGGTPLLRLARIGNHIGLNELLAKDEGLNPTGSFKARGLCLAASRARELGITTLSIPTAGNAGSAMAAYCARGGMRAVIYVPRETPPEFLTEYRDLGAQVTIVDGTISDAGARMASEARDDWFPVSTLQEPYRLEGKKTMGLELAEQLAWQLPDVILYPTGGGTGLLGMWKAFDELEAIGMLDSRRPRMIAVQAEGCAPIVKAFEAGDSSAAPWENATTVANGLRVPKAFADREILSVIRASKGTAITIDDDAMLAMLRLLAGVEGIYTAPEAAATIVAAQRLVADGTIHADERVVTFLTGNAYKYLSSL
ncbi:MAG: threonine synthase [Acidobacteria bacterium]|nr:threonine synthase [Acidobacteriota bacterium]